MGFFAQSPWNMQRVNGDPDPRHDLVKWVPEGRGKQGRRAGPLCPGGREEAGGSCDSRFLGQMLQNRQRAGGKGGGSERWNHWVGGDMVRPLPREWVTDMRARRVRTPSH